MRTIKFLPPPALLDDVKLPSRDGIKTVGDMVKVLLADEEAIRLKNADMQALREYRASLLSGEAKR